MFEFGWALFCDVSSTIVRQPHRTGGKSERMVKGVAWEEDLADAVVACEDSACALGKKPLVKPLPSICAFRIDGVFVRDAKDVPDSGNLREVASLIEATVHHLQPDPPGTQVVVQ